MTSLKVTAHLITPCIGIDGHAFMLDGPLSWAYAQRALASGQELPPLTPSYAADFPLPLERWVEGGTWGWCSSRARYEVASHTTVEIRRKPAAAAMARFGADRRMHLGLGPHKARDAMVPAVWAPVIEWHVEAVDQDDLESLLTLITHLGARHRNGFGTVQSWRIEPGAANAWRDRPMPHPSGIPAGVRAPYHHHTRRVPCL